MRLALGLSYDGRAYQGWQSQPGGRTVQDKLESALSAFTNQPTATLCAGRTDAGVHGLMQVVHIDTDLSRDSFSWVRGTNRFLPKDIAVHWAQEVLPSFTLAPAQLDAATLTYCSNLPFDQASTHIGWAGYSARWMATPCAWQLQN